MYTTARSSHARADSAADTGKAGGAGAAAATHALPAVRGEGKRLKVHAEHRSVACRKSSGCGVSGPGGSGGSGVGRVRKSGVHSGGVDAVDGTVRTAARTGTAGHVTLATAAHSHAVHALTNTTTAAAHQSTGRDSRGGRGQSVELVAVVEVAVALALPVQDRLELYQKDEAVSLLGIASKPCRNTL